MVAHCLFEQWEDVQGYEGIYQVSSLGRVKSLSRTVVTNGTCRKINEKILKDNIDKHGYVYYFLYKNGKCQRVKCHRLVAKTFLDNPNGYNLINHKDENKRNNAISNLEWCDPAYNLNYGNRSKKYMKPVLMIDSDSKEVIRKFDSLKQVETELHISHSKVSAVCYGKRKTAGGFCWRFADDSVLSF